MVNKFKESLKFLKNPQFVERIVNYTLKPPKCKSSISIHKGDIYDLKGMLIYYFYWSLLKFK